MLRRIVRLLAENKGKADIARLTGVSRKTVQRHAKRLSQLATVRPPEKQKATPRPAKRIIRRPPEREDEIYLPSELEIRVECEKIQAGWTEFERLVRAGQFQAASWLLGEESAEEVAAVSIGA